jgi:hypothetical protein
MKQPQTPEWKFLLSLVKWRQSQTTEDQKEDLVSNCVVHVKASLENGGVYQDWAISMGETASQSQYYGGQNKNRADRDYYMDKVLVQLERPRAFLMRTRKKCESEPYIVLIGLLLIDLFDEASLLYVETFIDGRRQY